MLNLRRNRLKQPKSGWQSPKALDLKQEKSASNMRIDTSISPLRRKDSIMSPFIQS